MKVLEIKINPVPFNSITLITPKCLENKSNYISSIVNYCEGYSYFVRLMSWDKKYYVSIRAIDHYENTSN
jgi:hypothetical protein